MPSAPSNFRSRNVLITGGASGLGAGIARAFAMAGARVIILDLDESLGKSMVAQLELAGCTATHIPVDVTSLASVAKALHQTLAWLPKGETIDAAILSAGINGNPFDLIPGDASELLQPESLESCARSTQTLQVNLIGVLHCVQLIVKYGMGLSTAAPKNEQNTTVKSVMLIGSLGSYRGLPRAVDYSAAKWGVRGMLRSLRQQLPAIGVRVNMVAPGFVKTPLLSATVPMYEQLGVKFAREEDVVEAVMQASNDLACSGKAFGVSSEGIVDLVDEANGMDAANVMNDLAKREIFGTSDCPMGFDQQKTTFKES